MPYYRRHRRDATHQRIVEALRKAGASVVINADKGGGEPDLWVGYKRRTLGLEVKSDKKARLRETQMDFLARWRGDEIITVITPEDALRAIGALAPAPPPY